jgi:hypothetical protein
MGLMKRLEERLKWSSASCKQKKGSVRLVFSGTWRRVVRWQSCCKLHSTLKSEAICSSETSIAFLRATRRYIPEDSSSYPCLWDPKTQGYGREYAKETGNRSFRDLLSDWVERILLNGAGQIEQTATQLQRNSRETEKLNSQATEQTSLLTVVLQRSYLVSAVLTCFCDSFASLDGAQGWRSC